MMPSHADAPSNNDTLQAAEKTRWYIEMRGWIMVVAVLIASLTYASGLNPPGGFWQDNDNGHKAGTSILLDSFTEEYKIFYYANTSAFMISLIIIALLMNHKFYCDKAKVIMLNLGILLVMIALVLAYVYGCLCVNNHSHLKLTISLFAAAFIFMTYSMIGAQIRMCFRHK
jgi:Domain of unknown function